MKRHFALLAIKKGGNLFSIEFFYFLEIFFVYLFLVFYCLSISIVVKTRHTTKKNKNKIIQKKLIEKNKKIEYNKEITKKIKSPKKK